MSLRGAPGSPWNLTQAVDALGDAARQASRPGAIWLAGLTYQFLNLGWAFGAMVVQALGYAVTTRCLKMAQDQIEADNSAFGGLLGTISLSIGGINAACIS